MNLTVCTVNYYTEKYIYFQDYIFRELANNKDHRRLVCNVTPFNEGAEALSLLPRTEVFYEDTSGLSGSESHGVGLNALISRIDTEYAVIADPDSVVLLKDWDTVCLETLDDQTVAIGTPYPPHAVNRYQGYPNQIFIFFDVAAMRSMDIDFRPENYRLRRAKGQINKYIPWLSLEDRDTSWNMPVKFREHGYLTHCFDFLKSNDSGSVVLAPDARGDEHHWRGIPIVSHQGRSGSRGFDRDPISILWLDRICEFLNIDRQGISHLIVPKSTKG